MLFRNQQVIGSSPIVGSTTDNQGRAVVSFEPKVLSGWFRQHVKLTLEVVAGEKTLLTKEARLVIGFEAQAPRRWRSGSARPEPTPWASGGPRARRLRQPFSRSMRLRGRRPSPMERLRSSFA